MWDDAGVWRNTYLKPRFAGLDGRVSMLLVLTLIYVRLWTVEVTGSVALLLALIELWKGITPEVFLRFVRSTIAGSKRPGTLKDHKRRAIDYGHIENMHALKANGVER